MKIQFSIGHWTKNHCEHICPFWGGLFNEKDEYIIKCKLFDKELRVLPSDYKKAVDSGDSMGLPIAPRCEECKEKEIDYKEGGFTTLEIEEDFLNSWYITDKIIRILP